MLARQARRVPGAPRRRHVARSRGRARRAGAPAGIRRAHLSRQDEERGSERPVQRDLRLRRGVRGQGGRSPGGPDGQQPGEVRAGVRLRRGVGTVDPAGGTATVRTVDPGHPRRGREPRHPVHPPERAVARAARAGEVPAADPGDDDLTDERARRGHRERQEDDEPVARVRRSPGAEERGRAERGRCRRGGRADRVPGRHEAARRQPRPRRRAGHPNGSRRSRGLQASGEGVAERQGGGGELRHGQRLPGARDRRADGRHRATCAGARDRRREAHGRGARGDHEPGSPARDRSREGPHAHQGRRGRRAARQEAGVRHR